MEDKIPEIVLTGGPCAGKTSSLSYISEKLRDYGWRVFIVPEVATMFISGGLHDIAKISKKDPKKNFEIEKAIFLTQFDLKKRFLNLAKVFKEDKKVIIFDRGPMDVLAYMEKKDFWNMVAASRQNVEDVRDDFDAVIHLVTAANGAPAFYVKSNNPARIEDLEEAKKADQRTLNAWIGCPHLKVVDNSTDFNGKLKRVFQAISRALGIPVPLEIERKFLLKEIPDFNDINFKGIQKVEIEQMYLLNPGDSGHLRIRKRGQLGSYRYYQTKKIKVKPGVRYEVEKVISEKEYLLLCQFRDPDTDIIEKHRHCFVYKNQYFELDVFLKPKQFCLLEIELTEENDKIELPPFLNIEKEVTNDSRYSNSAIAKKEKSL